MLRRLDNLTYKSDIELIEHIKCLDAKDKLDKTSLLNLLLHRPLVYLACYDDKERSIAIFESIIIAKEYQDTDAYEESIYNFIKILTTEEVNFTLLQNLTAAAEKDPEEFAWVLRSCLLNVDVLLQKDLEREFKSLMPKNVVEPVFKAIVELNKKAKENLKKALDLSDDEADEILGVDCDEIVCNKDKEE